MSRKGIIYLLIGLFELIMVVTCVVRVATWSPSEGREIAFIPKTISSPYWIRMDDAMQKFADDHSFRLITQAAPTETDVMQQVQIVENLIIRGVDLIVLAPSGSRQLVNVVKSANEKGIPVIIIDSKLDEALVKEQGVEILCFVGSDNFSGGFKAGQNIANKIGAGKVAVLEGVVGHESSDARIAGFTEGISGFPRVTLVSQQSALMERKKGFDVTQDIFSAHSDISALFAANDEMAMGAVEAVDQLGKLDDVVVVGFDANADARASVASGRLSATVAQFPDKMGELALEKALLYLDGGELDSDSYGSPLEVISEENVERFAQ